MVGGEEQVVNAGSGFRSRDSGNGRATERLEGTGKGANSELRIMNCALSSHFWPPSTAACLLPTAFEGAASFQFLLCSFCFPLGL